MSVSLIAMSHSPLLHHNQPAPEVMAEVEHAFEQGRALVREVDPTLIVSFGPDHYNGFFYDIMPMACVGLAGFGLGDYDGATGPLNVPGDLAADLADHVLDSDVDVAMSRKMGLDHGAVQPLEILFGGLDTPPVIPVFVNGVARPFSPMRRIRALGQAVGAWAAEQSAAGERVLLIASGGLSHDPPVPQWATASEEVRAGLLDGRNPTPEARDARQQRVIETGKAFAAGTASIMDLAPEWDAEFMRACATHDLAAFDAYQADEMEQTAGHSVHEVRTWVAAFSALGAVGGYEVGFEYYRPIREFIAGFGVMTARTKEDS